jgi:hypothetical protein
MDTKEILAQIDTEIARLQQVKSILSGSTTTKVKLGRPKKSKVIPIAVVTKKQTMSPEGRAKIAAAQKARWAKARKAEKKAA